MARNLSLLLALCLSSIASGCQPLTTNNNPQQFDVTTTDPPTTTVEPSTVEPTTSRTPVQFHINVHLPNSSVCNFEAPNADISVMLARTTRAGTAKPSYTKWTQIYNATAPFKQVLESGNIAFNPTECADCDSICEKFDTIIVKYRGKDIYISHFEGVFGGKEFRYGPPREAKCYDVEHVNQWIGTSGNCSAYFGGGDAYFIYEQSGLKGVLNENDFNEYLRGSLSTVHAPCYHHLEWKLELKKLETWRVVRPLPSFPGKDSYYCTSLRSVPDVKYALVHYNGEGAPTFKDDKIRPMIAEGSSKPYVNGIFNFTHIEAQNGLGGFDQIDAIYIHSEIYVLWIQEVVIKYKESGESLHFSHNTNCNPDDLSSWIGKAGACEGTTGSEEYKYFLWNGNSSALTVADNERFLAGKLSHSELRPCSSKE